MAYCLDQASVVRLDALLDGESEWDARDLYRVVLSEYFELRLGWQRQCCVLGLLVWYKDVDITAPKLLNGANLFDGLVNIKINVNPAVAMSVAIDAAVAVSVAVDAAVCVASIAPSPRPWLWPCLSR